MNPVVTMLPTSTLPRPIGLYSHASSVESPARMLFVAGQLAIDHDGRVFGINDINAQFQQVFENLGAVLQAGGYGFADVVRFTSYVTGRSYIEPFYAARAKLFPTLFPTQQYPPNTLLIVTGLVSPDFLIEVEAVAAIR
jgi:2-iminobutanoate/2-iminopropanoate deaminase